MPALWRPGLVSARRCLSPPPLADHSRGPRQPQGLAFRLPEHGRGGRVVYGGLHLPALRRSPRAFAVPRTGTNGCLVSFDTSILRRLSISSLPASESARSARRPSAVQDDSPAPRPSLDCWTRPRRWWIDWAGIRPSAYLTRRAAIRLRIQLLLNDLGDGGRVPAGLTATWRLGA